MWCAGPRCPFWWLTEQDLLGVPDGSRSYGMLGLGYPPPRPRPSLVRNQEVMTHFERYDQSKYRTDEQIREWLVSLRR